MRFKIVKIPIGIPNFKVGDEFSLKDASLYFETPIDQMKERGTFSSKFHIQGFTLEVIPESAYEPQ